MFIFDSCFSSSNWLCMNCEDMNSHSKSPLFCLKCKAFKPIELYPSVLNSEKISKEDLDILNYR
jgi:hypothetical protein